MKNKKSKLLKILAFSTAFIAVICACLFLILNKNEDREPSVDDPSTNFVYDPTDLVPESMMKLSHDGTSATFSGLSGFTTNKTLVIPEYVYDSGKRYPVTKVAIDTPDYGSHAMFYNTIEALIIPDTVKEIETAALWGFSSLVYLKTPIVGQVIDDTSSINTLKDMPFASMFSYPSTIGSDPLEYPVDITVPSSIYNHTTYEFNWRVDFIDKFSGPGVYTSDSLAQNWYFVDWYDKEAYSGKPMRYYIPRSLQEVVVTKDTSLCIRSFADCGPIEKLTLPDTMKNLNQSYIFYGMNKRPLTTYGGVVVDDLLAPATTGLKEINLPSTCGALGIGCLGRNDFLTEVTLPSGILTISEGCFYKCSELVTVNIPSTVKTIGDGAFNNCSKLENIALFNGDKSNPDLGKQTGFNMPITIEKIGRSAFSLTKFTNISFPENNHLEEIGGSAFGGCDRITALSIPFIGKNKGGTEGKKENCLGWIFGGTGSGVEAWFNFQVDYTSSYGQSNVECQIGSGPADVCSFWIPTKLSMINITSETAVAPGALQGLSNVTSISINKDVSSFALGCMRPSLTKGSVLQSLSVPNVHCNNGANALGALFGTTSYIGSYDAVQGGTKYYIPTSLSTVRLTNSSYVYSGSLNNVTSLVNLTIDYTGSGQTIDCNVLHNNTKLENLTIPFVGRNQAKYYTWWYWWYNNDIRNNITWIFSDTRGSASDYWYSLYWNCVWTVGQPSAPLMRYMPSSLKSLTITNETEIYTRGLSGLRNLENLYISDTCTLIEPGAIGFYERLKSIRLPFTGCYITNGVSSNKTAFATIFENSYYDYKNINQGYGTRKVPSSLRTIEISDQITWIPNNAFANLSDIETITCEGAIDVLSPYAFYNCENLTNLNMPNRCYETIGSYAFSGCKRVNHNRFEELASYSNGELKSIYIGSYAFANTNIISEVPGDIPFTELQSIGTGAFSDCLQIKYADISGNIIGLLGFGDYIFSGCKALSEVKVGRQISKGLFKDCYTLNNVDLRNTDINYIPAEMFMNCKSLTFDDGAGHGLIQQQGTVAIGDYAFYGCESLGKFVIDESTTSIGNYAFTNCKRLEPMTIPRSVTTIKPDAFWNEGTLDEFYFWVYYPQRSWSSGWTNNWNCDYLVYVIGDADPDMFTYEYRSSIKGYIITGMSPGYSLSGVVRFPEYRNGIPVYGIDDSGNPNNTLKISSQKITRAIIPERFNVLNAGVFGSKIDAVKHSVEIFLEADDATAKKNFGADQIDWNFIGQGIVYTKELWDYASTSSTMHTVPFLKVDKLDFVIDSDTTQYLTFDGTAKTIALESVNKKGYVYGTYDTSIPVDMFNLTYTDNIRYGTAKATASVIPTELAKYNQDRTTTPVGFVSGSSSVSICFEEDAFEGDKELTFTINKKRVVVYSSPKVINTTFNDKLYYINDFSKNDITGLEGTNFTFSGRLATRDVNARVYKAVNQHEGDFEWMSVNIYLNGSNVTDNFDIIIGDLTVNILPQEIYAGFKNGEWSTTDGKYSAGALLFFQYTASAILPEVIAYNVDGTRQVKADSYLHVVQTTAAPVFPTYDKVTGTGSAPSKMTISLSGTTNYILRYYDGTPLTVNISGVPSEYNPDGTRVQSYNQDYYVVKATLKIKYYNMDYVIAPEDDYWEVTNFTPYSASSTNYFSITGLGDDTEIQARMYNIGIGSDPANTIANYSYNINPTLSTIVFDPQTWSTTSSTYDILLVRTDSTGNKWLDNKYYDIEIEVDVRINYNKFDVQYLIDSVVVPYSTIVLPDWGGELGIYIKAEADGLTHTLTAEAIGIDLSKIRKYSIVYLQNKGALEGVTPATFKNVGTYYVGVRITATNYETYYHNVRLDVVKGNVKFASLSKQYDAQRVDLDAAILKMDANQSITYRSYEVRNPVTGLWEPYGNDPHDIAPYEVGNYRVKVKVEYPANFPSNEEYFNNFDDYILFEITKRKITIDINGTKPYDALYKTWVFAPGSTDYPMIAANMLNGDEFIGTLSTNSPDDGRYGKNDVHWSVQWVVLNATTGDNSSNYEVEIIGTYEITKLDMTVQIINYDGVYDGNYHSVIVNVTQNPAFPPCSYTIYYTGDNRPANSTINPTYIDTKANPFEADDKEWKVKIEIKAPHYNDFKADAYVMIRRATITYTCPSPQFFLWDNNYHHPEVTSVNPFYTDIYYCKSTTKPSLPSSYPFASSTWSQAYVMEKDPGLYNAHALLVAQNYKAVYIPIDFEIGPYSPINPGEVTITDGGGQYQGSYDVYGNWVETEYSVTVTTAFASGVTSTIYYSTDPSAAGDLNHSSWSVLNPTFTQVGTHTVYIKVVALGKEPTIYTGLVTITPAPFPTNTFTVTGETVYYDGKKHSVTVTGIDNILSDVKGAYVAYSIDPNAYNSKIDSSFDPDKSKFEYVDTGLYTVYVAVIAPNFETLYGYAEVKIMVATIYAKVELDENIFEYSGIPLADSDLFVTTTDSSGVPILDADGNKIPCCHDGAMIVYYYPAQKLFNGTLQEDKTTLIGPPTELGYYYVEIVYRPTKNCYATTAVGFIQITPRVLKLIYEKSNEYNGLQQYPKVSVVSGTSDVINVIITETSGKDPIKIGMYNFDVDINMISGLKSNYVLDITNFDYEITPIKIIIGELLEDPTITGSGRYSATGLGIVHLDYDGEKIEIVESDLVNSDFGYLVSGNIMPGDRIDVSFMSNVRSVETRVWLLESDGVVHRNTFYRGMTHRVYDSTGADVTANYVFEIGLEVSKWYVPYEIPDIPDAVYVFDGEDHYPNIPNITSSYIQTPVFIAGNPVIRIAIGNIASISSSTVWSSVLSESQAGEYTYTIMATGPGRLPAYKECKLIIEKAPIEIEIDPLNIVYDDNPHQITYSITNFTVTYASFNILDFGTPEIRYYRVEDVDYDDLDDFYQNYSLLDPIYSQGALELLDAGKYYAVVFYMESLNFRTSYKIKEVEILRKNLRIDISSSNPSGIYEEKDYDGDKLSINLGNSAVVNQTDLISGHVLSAGFKNHYLIKTVSANAGRYETQNYGFEFVYQIYDQNGRQVQMNYSPYVIPEVVGVIKKIDLSESTIQVTDVVKQYDGEPAMPNVTTNADGVIQYVIFKSDEYYNCTFNFSDPEYIGIYDPRYPSNKSLFSDVGYYVVVCWVINSTNYNDLTSVTSFNVGHVRIIPRDVQVEWDNLVQDFINAELHPDAYFFDIDGNKIILDTIFTDGTTTTTTKRSGKWPVIAAFRPGTEDPNYRLLNASELFEIVPKKIIIPLEVESDYLNAKWSLPINLTDDFVVNALTSDILDTLVFGDTYGHEYGNIYTISANPGAYTDPTQFEYDIKVYDKDSNIEITEGFIWEVKGYVRIKSNQLLYKWEDKVIKYDGKTHDIWELITLINPTSHNGLELSFSTYTYTYDPTITDDVGNVVGGGVVDMNIDSNGTVIYSSNYPTFKNIGKYTFYFKISSSKYTDGAQYAPGQAEREELLRIPDPFTPLLYQDYHVVYVEIQRQESFLAIENTTIDKEYDGIAVSKSTLSTAGGYNGEVADLNFDFYSGSTVDPSTLMSSLPVNVGTYTLRVTSNYDIDPAYDNEIKNYTPLNVVMVFRITPAELKLDLKYDKDLNFNVEVDRTMVGTTRTITETNIPYSQSYVSNLATSDRIDFNFTGVLLRGHHTVKINEVYNPALVSSNFMPLSFIDDDGHTFNFQYRIYNPGLTTNPETTSNYEIEINLDLYVHYPFIDATIPDVTVKYDGNPHFGNPILTTCTSTLNPQIVTKLSDLTISYSNTGIEGDYSTTPISYTQPGKYKVYYKMVDTVAKVHEDKYDAYYITIEKLTRTYAGGIVDPSKSFDGQPAGIYDIYTGLYMPDNGTGASNDYSVILETLAGGSTMPDNYNRAEVTIKYHNLAFSGSLIEAIQQGEYEYSIIIPESEYYQELEIKGRFKISKAVIVISGTYYEEFDGKVKVYSDFTTGNPYYTLTINGLPIPSNLSVIASVQTTYASARTYRGDDPNYGVDFVKSGINTDYMVLDSGDDVSENYSIVINDVVIEITKARMVPEETTIEFEYDGDTHYATMVMKTPAAGVTYKYSSDPNCVLYPDNDSYWSPSQIGYSAVGTYTVYAKAHATNYVDEVFTITMKILKAKTTIDIPDLTREYNAEVLEPTSIVTNSDVIREKWVITYYIWDEGANSWLLMDGTVVLSDGTPVPEIRPINIGKYRIEVDIPESQSYLPVTGTNDFIIYGKKIRLYWPTRSYVYNAQTQVPIPTFDGVYQKDFDNGTFKYHIEVSDPLTGAPVTPISVGTYSALAVFDSKNYIFNPDDSTVIYNIIKRTITVKSSGSLADNGNSRTLGYKPEYDSSPGTYDHYFTVNNLAINSAGVPDYVKPGTEFSTIPISGGYVGTFSYHSAINNPAVFGQNFRLNGYTQTDSFTILGTSGSDVTNNYTIIYELDLIIDYSALDVEIVYDLEHVTGVNTGGIYTYDGIGYSYHVNVNLSNPATPYSVYFSYYNDDSHWIEDNAANAYLRPTYTDVPKDSSGNPLLLPGSTQSEPYIFYIKVVSGGYTTKLTGSITINQAESNFTTSITGSIGKVYDNQPIDPPNVTYTDMATYPNRIKYQYEKKNPDGTYSIISTVPVLAGDYRLTLIPDNIGDAPDYPYANYTPINTTSGALQFTFVIQKRPVAFDLTKFNVSDYYKVYDGTALAITINNSHFVYVGDSTKDAIVPGDTALGQLQTKSPDAGLYSGFGTPTSDLIQFGSIGGGGFEISPNKLDCYDVDWSTLTLEIAKAKIDVKIKNISVVFDGLPHVQTVASGHINFISPTASLEYASFMPYGYRIYYGFPDTANISGFISQVNAGNEDSISPSSYGLSLNEMSVAQTNVTPTPIPIVVVITCKNYECWVSDNSLPITIEIMAMSPVPPGTGGSSGGGTPTPGTPGSGWGPAPSGGPGVPGSGGGSYPTKPGYNPGSGGSIFPNLEYDGDIIYDGLPYMDPSRTGLSRNKPYYNDPTYGSDPLYESVQTVTYYYYGTDFTSPDYNIPQVVGGRRVGPVGTDGTIPPTDAGEYVFILFIDVFNSVGAQYFYQYFEIKPKDVTLEWDNTVQQVDAAGNPLFDSSGNPLLEVVFTYGPGMSYIPDAHYVDVSGVSIGTAAYNNQLSVGNSQTNAGTYTATLLADNSPGKNNYNILNTSIQFVIKKLSISDIVWPTDMKVQYGDQIELIDAANLKYIVDSTTGVITDVIDMGTGLQIPGLDLSNYPFTFDVAAMEIKPDLDPTNPDAGDKIKIAIKLNDPANTQWLSKENVNSDTDPANDNTESDDLEIEYTVIPRNLATDTEWDYVIEMPGGSSQPIYEHTGSAINPLVRVKLVNKADPTKVKYLVHPLNEVLDADNNEMTDGINPAITKFDYMINYADNINPSDDPAKVASPVLAKIILSTPNTNYVFDYEDELDPSGNPTGNKTTTPIEITKEFIIKDPMPTTIQLVSGSVMQFIQVSYSDPFDLVSPGDGSITIKGFDPTQDGLSFNPDGSDANILNRDEIIKNDTTGTAKNSIYLGRIHHMTFLNQVMAQISNPKDRMIVYDQNGEIVDRKYWDTSIYTATDCENDCMNDLVLFGSSWKVELYDETIIDSSGNYLGTVTSTSFTPTTATLIDDVSAIIFGDGNGDGQISNADGALAKTSAGAADTPLTIGWKYYAMNVKYIVDYLTSTTPILLDNASVALIKDCSAASYGSSGDFNSGYILP